MTKSKKEMTIGELLEKLSTISNGYYGKITISELLRMLEKEMTVGAMLDRLSSIAGDYYKDAVAAIERNRHMNDLTDEDIKIDKGAKQRITEAIIIDFINFVGVEYGVDYAIHTKDLPGEVEKNQKARGKRKGGKR